MSGAMFGGLVLFWVVVVLLLRSGVVVVPAAGLASPAVALLIGAVLGLIACVGAVVARAKVLRAAEGARREGWPPEASGRILTLLVIGWAMVEGPGLFSAALLLVLGDIRILWAAVPLCVVGMVLTAPRAEWFGPSRS